MQIRDKVEGLDWGTREVDQCLTCIATDERVVAPIYLCISLLEEQDPNLISLGT